MKKRFLAMFLALTMCLALLPAEALAAETSGTWGENLTWTLENGVLTFSGTGEMADDTGVSNPWLAQSSRITSIVIEDGVTSIGKRMFEELRSATKVTIPNSVTSIGSYAFDGCDKLESVTFPSGVTSVGEFAFRRSPWLKSLGDNAVAGSVYLKYNGHQGNAEVPDGIKTIAGGAFWGGSPVSITIPASVTAIGPSAFAFCHQTKDIYFGGSEAQWETIFEPLLASELEIDGFTSSDSIKSATMHYAGSTPAQPDQPVTPDKPSNLPTVESIPAAGTAVARTQTVKLDGKDVEFQCYAVKDTGGNETNYVKIRDLAQVLNGTKAQFNVDWDGVITITPNTPYQAVGGEGITPYTGDQPYTAVSNIPVRFNGSDVNLTSFQLKDSAGNGYTYYKLRDLGQLLNFNVTWNGSGIVVESDKPYTG